MVHMRYHDPLLYIWLMVLNVGFVAVVLKLAFRRFQTQKQIDSLKGEVSSLKERVIRVEALIEK